jgi:serine/threonine-protein kinase HipA
MEIFVPRSKGDQSRLGRRYKAPALRQLCPVEAYQLCESAVEVGAEVIEAAKNEPRWRPIAKQMVHAWNEGMSSLRDPKRSVQFRGLDAAISAAGFSDPEPAERTRVTVGRSELLATPGKPS